MLSVDRDGGVAELLAAVDGCVRRDVGPLPGLRVELPHRAVSHARWAGRRAIGDVEKAVTRKRCARGAVLRWRVGDGLPGCAGVTGHEEIAAAHERNADVDGLRREFYEDDAAAARRHAPPALLRRFAGNGCGHERDGFGDVREAFDARPAEGAIGGAPEAIVAGAEIEDAAVVWIDR